MAATRSCHMIIKVRIMVTRLPNIIVDEDTGQVVDDFTQIQGIGPAKAERLYAAGITRYAQIAKKTPDELAALFSDMIGVTEARLKQQDWIGQAKALAAEPGGKSAPPPAGSSQPHQHYAVFTVELLLDETLNVRRTRILHVQSQLDQTWANWDGEGLLAFIQENAGLATLQSEAADEAGQPVLGSASAAAGATSGAAPAAPQPHNLSGDFRMQELQMDIYGEHLSPWMAPAGEPFKIHLGLDLSQVENPAGQPLEYRATVYAKKIGALEKQVLGSARGMLSSKDPFGIDVGCQVMEKGAYRLEVLVALALKGEGAQPGGQIMALSEGKLLTVR